MNKEVEKVMGQIPEYSMTILSGDFSVGAEKVVTLN
jgi:hypothetical protein